MGKIELFEVVSFLREEPDEVAMICRVKLKEGSSKLEDALGDSSTITQHLEEEKDGTHIYFLRRKYGPESPTHWLFGRGGYLASPFEIRDGRIRASFLGNAKEIKQFRKAIEKTGMSYKVISLGDAKFSPNSPLGGLTAKQRKVLTTAYNLGYYDLPKRISSEELGRRLNMKSSTLVTHRIKAEKRLLAAVLNGS
jgi:hypothetical protein